MNGVVIAETMRRIITSTAFLLLVMFIALVGLVASSFAVVGSLWPALVSLVAIVWGADVIGPELSSGALQLIVSRPIPRWSYVLSRVSGVICMVTFAAGVGFASEMTARILRNGDAALPRLLEVMVSTVVVAALIVAMLTLLGSLTRGYYNLVIYLGSEIALNAAQAVLGVIRGRGGSTGQLLESHPIIEQSLIKLDDIVFASAPPEMTWQWLAQVIVTIAIVLLLACVAFRRREVPYAPD